MLLQNCLFLFTDYSQNLQWLQSYRRHLNYDPIQCLMQCWPRCLCFIKSKKKPKKVKTLVVDIAGVSCISQASSTWWSSTSSQGNPAAGRSVPALTYSSTFQPPVLTFSTFFTFFSFFQITFSGNWIFSTPLPKANKTDGKNLIFFIMSAHCISGLTFHDWNNKCILYTFLPFFFSWFTVDD